MDDREFGAGTALSAPFPRCGSAECAPGRRVQAVQLVDAALVDPHFAGAQDAVNVAFWYTFADTQQVVVDALSGFFFSDRDELLLRQDL
jgi:hypothetical protein